MGNIRNMNDQQIQANMLRATQGMNMGGMPQNMPPPQQQNVRGMGQGLGGNMNEAQMKFLATLPPDQQEEYIRKWTQDFEGKGQMAQDAMAKAQATMDGETPQGTTVRDGIYVAANPLAHLATAMKKNQAKGKYESALEERKKLSDSYGDSSFDYTSAAAKDYISSNL